MTPLGLGSAVASGALYYAGAYWFYLGALRHVPASFAAVSFYLIPIVGLAQVLCSWVSGWILVNGSARSWSSQPSWRYSANIDGSRS